MIKILDEYAERFSTDRYFIISCNVLRAYNEFNEARDQAYPASVNAVDRYTKLLVDKSEDISDGGTKQLQRTEIASATDFDFGAFALSRYSVRHFADKEIGREEIEQAIRWAQKTPSVCNRQSCRVHVFHDEASRTLALSHQNGNRGFGHESRAVMIVTSDLQHFHNPSERFQCWIDGGMFAMSLIYALHALNLGSCALNWSATCDRDVKLRSAVGIPDSEVVIMMIAVGHLPETFSVAQSPRKQLHEVVRWH